MMKRNSSPNLPALLRILPRQSLRLPNLIGFILGALTVCASANVWGQRTTPLQHLWEVQPDFGDIWSAKSTARSTYIDVEGLASDLAQVRLETAQMICVNYDREGFSKKQRAIELLLPRVANSDESINIRRTMMSALCVLDDGKHADKLWQASRSDPILDLMVQRALIQWKSSVARDAWRKALEDPLQASPQTLLAIEGLGTVGTVEDVPILTKLLQSNSATTDQRLQASKSLGTLQTSDLAELAEKYLTSNLPDRDRIAISLTRNHSDPKALNVMRSIYQTGSEPARREAAAAIATHFPEAAEELSPNWLRDRDMYFRRLALQIASTKDSQKTIEVAEILLRDEDFRLRQASRNALLQFAKNGNQQAVLDSITKQLAGDEWKSIEQAIILTVEMQDRNQCPRLLELLEHPQAEVHMHAAWALMELSEPGPILEKIFEQASKLTDGLENGTGQIGKSYTIKLSFLLECFGRHRFEPAYEMLMKYVPKNDFKMGNLNRCSAIWSISQLRKELDAPNLRAQFRERITDLPPDKPENYLVRFACIVALGEFGFRDSLDVIDRYGGVPPNPLGYAANWAKERIASSGK